ncbi:MAG: acetate--CoA ligase alpha subunit, partial [Planctomycetota bacterium]
LDSFFKPKSVAIIGASCQEGKVGHIVLDNIINASYQGQIFPVNPNAPEIHGIPCINSINALPSAPDLAVVIVPAKFVPGVIEELGKKGCHAAVVISAGFKETGIEGMRLEKELVETAKKYSLKVIGPNCLGLMDTKTSINASFARTMPYHGKVGFISQSGALCTAVLDWAKEERFGFSKFVSFGNRADISEVELIEYFGNDEETSVILAYLEGVKDGASFIRTVRKISQTKPVILYKSGTTSAGAKAVSSHTGSLAGSDSAYDAAFRQAGAIRAQTMEMLFNLAKGFAAPHYARGGNLAILTNAGGPGVIAADTCERSGIKLAALSLDTVNKLKEKLPSAASIYNPVDVLGDSLADRYAYTADVLLSDSGVDGLVVLLTPQFMTQISETASAIVEVAANYEKPVFTSFMGKSDVKEGTKILTKHNIPNYDFPEDAIYTFSAVEKYHALRLRPQQQLKKFSVDRETALEVIERLISQGIKQMGEYEAFKILSAYGIKTPHTILATTAAQALEAADMVGYPVAAKISSPDILHKSDAGGVKLKIQTPEELKSAYDSIMVSAKRYLPDARIHGIVIQKMLSMGRELIIGVNKDPQFGHVIMAGLGGIYVEILKDVSFRVTPIDAYEAQAMLMELKTHRLLLGARGEKAVDIAAIGEILLRVSQLVTELPQISEMDINPLIAYSKGEGCLAADARIMLGE